MEPEMALAVGRGALMMTLLISFPLLMVGMVVGVLISIIQAVTQIQEMTLTFVPKIFAMVLASVFLLPFIMQKMMEYATEMFSTLPIP